MISRRAPKPVLLLLLTLAAILAPQATKIAVATPVPSIARAVAATHVSGSTTAHRGGVAHPHSGRTELRAAPAPAAGPLHSTTARAATPSGPTLLLVQRPRPPTTRLTGSGIRAATGRSPPSPAGT